MIISTIQIRRDTKTNWESKNPTLANGELGVVTDDYTIKIGNGSDNWNTLETVTVNKNVHNTFTKAQRGSITSLADDTVAWDFTSTNDYNVTLTADSDITLATDGALGCVGQGGIIKVSNAEHITGWGTEFKWKNVPDDLSGDERFPYYIEAEDSIVIGRIQ